MSKEIKDNEMVAKNKKVLSCSTPEHQIDSPSHDSDSVYDSEAASPVPFLCTQDGGGGDTDVIWNFHTPTSKGTKSNYKSTTPVRKVKKTSRSKFIEKPIKRRIARPLQNKTELFQDLIELNKNLHELLPKKPIPKVEKPQSDEDLFSDTSDCSPRSTLKTKDRCLRKNVLSSKFIKTETESGLESDDSINEYLIKASQMVEEKMLYEQKPAKRPCIEAVENKLNPGFKVDIDQDSMDAILSNIKLDSPLVHKVKCDSPRWKNDSFDNFLGNLNDSALERLSQNQAKNDPSMDTPNVKKNTNWSVKELIIYDESPSTKSTFGRHKSMPESPSVMEVNKPSTSGMVFGRHNSMPFNESNENIKGNSPIRCTPDEIKKKHKQAREKLLAKRQLPFTQQQTEPQLKPSQNIPNKQTFQYKVRTTNPLQKCNEQNTNTDLKLLIEKKRQEALMKLRRRQPQHKTHTQ